MEARTRSGEKPWVWRRSHCLISKIKSESKDRLSYKVSFIKVALYSLFFNHQNLRNEAGIQHRTINPRAPNGNVHQTTECQKKVIWFFKKGKIWFWVLRVAKAPYSFPLEINQYTYLKSKNGILFYVVIPLTFLLNFMGIIRTTMHKVYRELFYRWSDLINITQMWVGQEWPHDPHLRNKKTEAQRCLFA